MTLPEVIEAVRKAEAYIWDRGRGEAGDPEARILTEYLSEAEYTLRALAVILCVREEKE